MSLTALVEALRASPGLALKRDIAPVADALLQVAPCGWLDGAWVRNGDDAAAIPDGDGHLLLAAEGMLPGFVAQDPWFAGYCAVMVNVSDIVAMGGRPYALVDVLFAGDRAASARVLAGMRAASEVFGVPVVGGHTSRHAEGATFLAAAIVGRARRLVTSFDARPGDRLVLAVDLRGSYRPSGAYFDAATPRERGALRRALEVLPALAEAGRVRAGKDVSMAGIAGTLIMLCEGSGVGATLVLDALPQPADVPLARWLATFPSFGFLLAVDPGQVAEVCARFAEAGITSADVGSFDAGSEVRLRAGAREARLWDVAREPLTGFGRARGEAR